MGAWEVGPLDDDAAMDWLSFVQDDIEKRMRKAFKKAKRYPVPARAAAHILPKAYRCGLIDDGAVGLADMAIEALETHVVGSSYMGNWKNEEIQRRAQASVREQIRILKRFRNSLEVV